MPDFPQFRNSCPYRHPASAFRARLDTDLRVIRSMLARPDKYSGEQITKLLLHAAAAARAYSELQSDGEVDYYVHRGLEQSTVAELFDVIGAGWSTDPDAPAFDDAV